MGGGVALTHCLSREGMCLSSPRVDRPLSAGNRPYGPGRVVDPGAVHVAAPAAGGATSPGAAQGNLDQLGVQWPGSEARCRPPFEQGGDPEVVNDADVISGASLPIDVDEVLAAHVHGVSHDLGQQLSEDQDRHPCVARTRQWCAAAQANCAEKLATQHVLTMDSALAREQDYLASESGHAPVAFGTPCRRRHEKRLAHRQRGSVRLESCWRRLLRVDDAGPLAAGSRGTPSIGECAARVNVMGPLAGRA